MKNLNLSAIKGMNNEQTQVYAWFHGNKGRSASATSLLEKLANKFVDAEAKDKAKAEKLAKLKIEKAMEFLREAGVITKTVKEGKEIDGEFTMPALEIVDLDDNNQILIGDKKHTSLTANPNQIFYKGDNVLYDAHPLSPEFKSGKRICVGEVKSFHVNEEGFLYLEVLKSQEVDKDGKNLKRKTCAVKASKAQLVDQKIPTAASKCVTYKKAAGLKEPSLMEMPDVTKGNHVIFFTNIHSPKAKEFGQIIEGMKAGMKSTLTIINTDHQVSECIKFGIRNAPTVLIIKDGKVVETIINKIDKVIK